MRTIEVCSGLIRLPANIMLCFFQINIIFLSYISNACHYFFRGGHECGYIIRTAHMSQERLILSQERLANACIQCIEGTL